MRRTHSCALLIHALHSPMRCTHSSPFTYQLCMCYTCSCIVICVAIIYASQLFTHCIYLSITLIHASLLFMHRTHLCVALIYVSHLSMCCTYSFVALISCITLIQWCVALIHALYLFMYRFVYTLRYISLFTYQPYSLQPPYSVFLLDIHQVSDLLARVFHYYDQSEYASKCT